MNGLSIIITYYKGEQYIYNCINSILNSFRLASGELKNQIIVVIDSMDDADHIASQLAVTYASIDLTIIKNDKNLGVSNSRNVGLENIKYDFYTIIDQDDHVRADYFSVLEQNLSDTDAIHLINGSVRYVNTGVEVPINYFTPNFSFRSLILQSTYVFTPGLVIFNRKFISPKHLFIETSSKYKGCDDLAAYLNILKKNEVSYKYIPVNLFVYCLHDNNYSNNMEEMLLSYKSVIDYFELEPQLSMANKSLMVKVNNRYNFLYARKTLKFSVSKLILNYPYQFFNHFLFSLVEKNRINRLIYWIRYKLK